MPRATNGTKPPAKKAAAKRAPRRKPAVVHDAVLVNVADLTPHPRNYRTHPEAQLEHIAASIREAGFYKNIVLARGDVILAGHGTVAAAPLVPMLQVSAVRLDIEPDCPQALKILAGDNELLRFADVDDRVLAEILKEIEDQDPAGLLGTGYDEMQLASLVMVTRHSDEIANFNTAAEWVGLPEFEPDPDTFRLVINFETKEDRQEFCDRFEIELIKAGDVMAWTTRWPFVPRHDLQAVRFTG